MQLGHKRRPADALHIFRGDNESKISGELRLLYKAETFGCVAHPLHIVKSPLQN